MADIFTVADRFRREMLRRERGASSELVRQYGELWKRIRGEITSLTKRYYQALEAGEATSTAWLYQLERLQQLRRQVEAEMRAFARFADTRIQTEQWEAVQMAQRHAQALTAEALGPAADLLGFGTELATAWNHLPREAMADLVGFLQDGSPLKGLLDELGPLASETVGRELVSGLGLGLSPREVASRIRREFGGDLVRALRVARTETMRAYREASRRSYEANGDLVGQWIWHAGLDNRTCAACWAMHGTVHPVTERLDDHPNGRCAMVPVTKSWEEIGKQYGVDLSGVPETRAKVAKGTDLFAKLSPDDQLQILGPSKFRAYQAGAIKLDDLVGRTRSRKWGSHRYERSLKDVLGDDAQRWYGGGPEAGPAPVPGVPQFKTVAEAEQWVRDLDVAEGVYFKGFDIRTAQEIADSLAYHKQIYPDLRFRNIGNNRELNKVLRALSEPEVRARYEGMGERFGWSKQTTEMYIKKELNRRGVRMLPNAYAMASGDSFFVSYKWAIDYDAMVKSLTRDVTMGWHPPGCNSIKSVIDHEINHVIKNQHRRLLTDAQSLVRRARANPELYPSDYAKKNASEFLAEGWAEFLNSPNAREMAREIGALVLRILEGSY